MPSKKPASPTDPKPGDPKPKPNSSTLRGKGGKPIMTSVQKPGRAGGPAINVGKPLAKSSNSVRVNVARGGAAGARGNSGGGIGGRGGGGRLFARGK